MRHIRIPDGGGTAAEAVIIAAAEFKALAAPGRT